MSEGLFQHAPGDWKPVEKDQDAGIQDFIKRHIMGDTHKPSKKYGFDFKDEDIKRMLERYPPPPPKDIWKRRKLPYAYSESDLKPPAVTWDVIHKIACKHRLYTLAQCLDRRPLNAPGGEYKDEDGNVYETIKFRRAISLSGTMRMIGGKQELERMREKALVEACREIDMALEHGYRAPYAEMRGVQQVLGRSLTEDDEPRLAVSIQPTWIDDREPSIDAYCERFEVAVALVLKDRPKEKLRLGDGTMMLALTEEEGEHIFTVLDRFMEQLDGFVLSESERKALSTLGDALGYEGWMPEAPGYDFKMHREYLPLDELKKRGRPLEYDAVCAQLFGPSGKPRNFSSMLKPKLLDLYRDCLEVGIIRGIVPPADMQTKKMLVDALKKAAASEL